MRLIVLMKGCPPQMWKSILLNSELSKSRIFEYSPDSLSLFQPSANISWVLEWLLVTFSMKHRFVWTHKPPIEWLAQDSLSAVNKLLWKLCPRTSSSLPAVSRTIAKYPECVRMRDSLVGRWGTHFRRVLLRLASSPLFKRGSSNMFGLAKLGLQLLRKCEYFVLPLDKQPGFALVQKCDFQTVERIALSSKHYAPFPLSQLSMELFNSQVSLFAKEIAELGEDRRLRGNILARAQGGSLATPLGITIKSHKLPGAVGVRTIHRGSNPKLGDFLIGWFIF